VNLILFERHELSDSASVTLTGTRARHMLDILHVAAGHQVRVGIVDGPAGVGVVRSIEAGAVTLAVTLETSAPARPSVDLLLALPRPKILRRLWAQIAALGVGQVIVTNAARVERDYFDTHLLRPESYGPLLVEGLQQARDTRLPTVSVHKRFRVLVEDDLATLFPSGLRLAADPGAALSIQAAVRDRRGNDPGGRVLLAVGPEGGWNEFELRLLAQHEFRAVGLGSRTLRTDTACIALLALVHDAVDTAGPAVPNAEPDRSID
jgi:RsmE family RNA methyltransferase